MFMFDFNSLLFVALILVFFKIIILFIRSLCFDATHLSAYYLRLIARLFCVFCLCIFSIFFLYLVLGFRVFFVCFGCVCLDSPSHPASSMDPAGSILVGWVV